MSKELEALDHLRKGVQYINQDESPAFISQYEEDIDITEQKLGQLEDIEDELGIDLITLFKALKNGCYGMQNGKIYKMKIVRLDSQDKENIILFRNKHYGGNCYSLKDYDITWALTKEELEKGMK